MGVVSLKELCKGKITDKDNTYGFIKFYENLFLPYKDSDIKLLEIGVNKGGSLKLWRDFFSKAKIYGIDINPKIFRVDYETDRVQVDIVDQSRKDLLYKYVGDNGPFDFIIDDGSHMVSHQIISFKALWEHTSRVYIIEDVITSYWRNHIDIRPTCIDFFVNMIDDLNYVKKTYYTDSIDHIEFRNNMIAIYRR